MKWLKVAERLSGLLDGEQIPYTNRWKMYIAVDIPGGIESPLFDIVIVLLFSLYPEQL